VFRLGHNRFRWEILYKVARCQKTGVQ
jgi:hypothetical protein